MTNHHAEDSDKKSILDARIERAYANEYDAAFAAATIKNYASLPLATILADHPQLLKRCTKIMGDPDIRKLTDPYAPKRDNDSHVLTVGCLAHMLTAVELLDGTQTGYATDIVYFGYPDVLSPDMQPSQCILVRGENYLFPYSCTDRATVQAKELFAVFNAAKQFLQTHEQVSLYEELVRKGHSSHSLDEVINSASIKLGYSLVFCDKKFRILSYSTSIPVTDKLWKKNIERGYCTYDFIKNVMSLEAVQGASASIEAVEVSCPESPYRKCSSKVFLNGVQVGFVLMIENNIPFTAEHLAAMSDVSRAISSVVGHYHPELFQYTSADQQLLEALLIGTPADILADSISHLRVSDAMYALCIQPKTFLKENKLKQQLYPVIRHIFPEAYMTVHDNALVLLVPDQSSVIFVDTQKIMLKTMAEYHLDVGISLVFSKMDEFYRAYQQARTVLEWNHRIPDNLKKEISWDQRYPMEHQIHRYSEIEFYEMMNKIKEPEKLADYIHPALYRLNKYDQRTGNELYHTLEVYLQCFHNNKETANILCIHRNSLAYRMEKIIEIGKADLNDPMTEFLLRMSFKLVEYLKIRDLDLP